MSDENGNVRLEAFSDGVFAIALTLLIIDVKLPASETLTSTDAVWRALQHLAPRMFAFLLSFCIILITWVNHHAALKLVSRSSAAFIYTNGLLLLTVVLVPFPTALLGDFILTDHAAPAVVLYDAVLTLQALGWVLMTAAALRDGLSANAASASTISERNRNGYFAVGLYSLLTVTAFWFPASVAIVTTASWLYWLVLGLRMKHDRAIADVPVIAA